MKTNSEDRGAVQTLLNAVNTGQTKVVEEAERIQILLFLEGQRQGVWGEMVLNNILTNNLGFREVMNLSLKKTSIQMKEIFNQM